MVKIKIDMTALREALLNVAAALQPALENMTNAIRKLGAMFQPTPPTITERLERGGWRAVDAKQLDDPDERWEYQRWILSAPMRWWKGRGDTKGSGLSNEIR